MFGEEIIMTFSILRKLIGLPLFVIVSASGCVAYNGGRDSPRELNSSGASAQPLKPPENPPGIIVHIDPQTGQIVSPPAALPSGEVPKTPVATATPPLPEPQETLSPVPGGGVIIQLDERFSTPLTAILEPDGKVRFEHKPSEPSANE
jgi:hypothetical protein